MSAFKSGFITIIGRPNAGKSTLMNTILQQKIAIVSDKPQTTQNKIRGFYTTDDAQLIFIDTPVDECINRINARGEQKEIFEKADFQKKVLQGYEKCFEILPTGCNLIRIDGTQSKEKVFEDICSILFKKSV